MDSDDPSFWLNSVFSSLNDFWPLPAEDPPGFESLVPNGGQPAGPLGLFVNPSDLSQNDFQVRIAETPSTGAAMASEARRTPRQRWGEIPRTRRKGSDKLKVTAPKKGDLNLSINKTKASDYLEGIKTKFDGNGGEATLWLEQLSGLLRIAEHKEKRPDGQAVSREARNGMTRYRRRVGRGIFELSRDNNGDLKALAKRVTMLTESACSDVSYPNQTTIRERQLIALQELKTLDQATKALRDSDTVDIAGVDIRTFIPKSEASTFE